VRSGLSIVVMTSLLFVPGCGHRTERDRPLRATEVASARAALAQVQGPAGFHSTHFGCAESSDLPTRCFRSKRVLAARNRKGIQRLLADFGISRRSLGVCLALPRLRQPTSSVNCDGYGYLGRYAVAITARSGANESRVLSGTYVSLTIVRVQR
jgi:hypothetical protein